MFIYEKSYNDDINTIPIMEASTSNTYIIRDTIYPKVEKMLSTPEGERKFANLVSAYINKNSSKLTTIGPQYRILFTYADKDTFYEAFGVTEAELSEAANTIVKTVNEKSQWLLIRKNPIMILFYTIIRYFTIKKNSKMLNNALIVTSLYFYVSMFDKYFKYEPNVGVMQYTIDNLPRRFMIKKQKHLFGTLTQQVQNSWRFHEKNFTNGSDREVIRFIQRIRNDQNSLIKKIAREYYDNKEKGLSVVTSVDTFDDGVAIDIENNTNKVELATSRIVTKLLMNGVSIKLSDFAAQASGNISKLELRNYLTKIIVDKNSKELESFIGSILFIYLYEEKHPFTDINSKQFIGFAIALFKKTNSKDENITNIKTMLDKWGVDTGIYGKFNRVATRVDYTRAIFLYFIMAIQQYN